MTTFVNLRKRASQRFGDPSFSIVADTTSATLPSWDDYINEAYRDVLQASPLWPWNEAQPANLTFPANTFAGVALPADLWQVEAVWDQTDFLPLVPLEGRSDYLNQYPQQNEVGIPQHYRIFNSKLFIYPAPTVSTQVRVDGVQRPADLVSGTDVPVFPVAYHHMLVDGALAYAYQDDGNLDLSKASAMRFEGILARMRQDLLQYRQERYPEIVDTFS